MSNLLDLLNYTNDAITQPQPQYKMVNTPAEVEARNAALIQSIMAHQPMSQSNLPLMSGGGSGSLQSTGSVDALAGARMPSPEPAPTGRSTDNMLFTEYMADPLIGIQRAPAQASGAPAQTLQKSFFDLTTGEQQAALQSVVQNTDIMIDGDGKLVAKGRPVPITDSATSSALDMKKVKAELFRIEGIIQQEPWSAQVMQAKRAESAPTLINDGVDPQLVSNWVSKGADGIIEWESSAAKTGANARKEARDDADLKLKGDKLGLDKDELEYRKEKDKAELKLKQDELKYRHDALKAKKIAAAMQKRFEEYTRRDKEGKVKTKGMFSDEVDVADLQRQLNELMTIFDDSAYQDSGTRGVNTEALSLLDNVSAARRRKQEE
jgi:hypothetical protein